TPRQLMWWKFRRHRVAVFSAVVLIIFYVVALFASFISPYDPNEFDASYKFVQPMLLSFKNANGDFSLRPGVHGLIPNRDPETLRITYEIDKSTWYPLHFFVKSNPYKLFGFIESDIHLFGLGEEAGDLPVFLLGSDRLGRDMFSRVLYGARISLSIGLVSVFLSLTLGIVLGGISGYYGGAVDNIIQRMIEFIRSIPTLPLWMALSAALPADWSQEWRYFGITIILSAIAWTGLGRQVRGRFLALRTEDFVLAARLSGARDRRIILRHMVPSFTSHIIASLTLSIPGIILAETALSFLGLGLRQPVISWGVLLQEAQNVRTVALAPWLLLPGLAVVITVLAFNFLGDGLRDAADPFSH
ncbi:MAG TPA: ABC transporter permease, partial [Aggregatilineales bacterium]|nr:ABC transporter permease [Aggregatilineales bacterium]